MTRSSARVTHDWLTQVIYIQEPDISSMANLALLTRYYFGLDRSIYREYRMSRIRRRWMKEQMKTPDSNGGLTCSMCGRSGLNPWEKNIKKKATLDHIKSICDGGEWNNPSNFQVACYSCNSRKNSELQKI